MTYLKTYSTKLAIMFGKPGVDSEKSESFHFIDQVEAFRSDRIIIGVSIELRFRHILYVF